MKKNIVLVGIVITVIIMIIGLFVLGSGDSEFQESIEKDISIVTQNYKTEIILYVEDIEFDEACYVRKIDKISKENLTSDESYVYTVFVINDLNNSVTLNEEDLKIIYDISYNDKIDFFYFGKNYANAIKEAGVFSQTLLENELSLGVIYERGIRTEVLGTWDDYMHKAYLEENRGLLAEIILAQIVSKIRFDNK